MKSSVFAPAQGNAVYFKPLTQLKGSRSLGALMRGLRTPQMRAYNGKVAKITPKFHVSALSEEEGRPIESMRLYLEESKDEGGVSVIDYIRGEGPRFFSPIADHKMSTGSAQGIGGVELSRGEKPLMLFLPGIDSTGMNAIQQFPALMRHFDLKSLSVPLEDRTTFMELLDMVEEFLRDELATSPPDRPVYLLGESFGGVLSLAVAHRCSSLVHRVVLVNPATSFPDSIWPQAGPLLSEIPDQLYNDLLPIVLSPIVSDPIALARGGVRPESDALMQLRQLGNSFIQMRPVVTLLSQVLPKKTLMWKLKMIEQGNEYLKPRMKQIMQRVLVVCGEDDRLIPSGEEAKRLKRVLPRCSSKIIEKRGHAMLMEDGVDIMQIIEDMGFYTSKRVMTATPTKPQSEKRGYADPIEVPTPKEVELDSEGFFSNLTRFTSPVFFSTDPSGKVVQGLDSIPEARPLVLVGNHQTFAPDTYVVVKSLLEKKGLLVRGLAHPVAFGATNGEQGQNGMSIMSSYGAVPVTPKNMYKLLDNGEVVLLYPGGVREGFKNKGEEYQLIWPNRPEVIRMAARFNATIVPLSAIGVDDTVNIALDGRELSNIPFLGDRLRQNATKVPSARKGVAQASEVDDAFISPVLGFPPRLPSRMYFLFGKPIQTRREDLKDGVVARKQYNELKGEVEGGIKYLLKKRNSDPYNNFVQRFFYESRSDWKKQAPTFDP